MGETIVSFLLGIGLSAAVGFRVFVPMLLVSLASMAGVLTLSPGFQWMGTPVAALVFAMATLIELLSFLVPWVSNALDSIATPAATSAVDIGHHRRGWRGLDRAGGDGGHACRGGGRNRRDGESDRGASGSDWGAGGHHHDDRHSSDHGYPHLDRRTFGIADCYSEIPRHPVGA
jgi:hypothetical protein